MPWLESLRLAGSAAEAKIRGEGRTRPTAKKMLGQATWVKRLGLGIRASGAGGPAENQRLCYRIYGRGSKINDSGDFCLLTDDETSLELSPAPHLCYMCVYTSLCPNLLPYTDR